LSLEEAKNTGRGEFTRHSPELGIVQSIFSPAARRTISEQYENIGAATVG
jgi:indole-3-glycerol phosphate synthase